MSLPPPPAPSSSSLVSINDYLKYFVYWSICAERIYGKSKMDQLRICDQVICEHFGKFQKPLSDFLLDEIANFLASISENLYYGHPLVPHQRTRGPRIYERFTYASLELDDARNVMTIKKADCEDDEDDEESEDVMKERKPA